MSSHSEHQAGAAWNTRRSVTLHDGRVKPRSRTLPETSGLWSDEGRTDPSQRTHWWCRLVNTPTNESDDRRPTLTCQVTGITFMPDIAWRCAWLNIKKTLVSVGRTRVTWMSTTTMIIDEIYGARSGKITTKCRSTPADLPAYRGAT